MLNLNNTKRIIANTKLTLTVEKTVIEKAKKYAKKKGLSLSEIIQYYLKAITTEALEEEIEISPTVKSFKASFKMPKTFDYKIN